MPRLFLLLMLFASTVAHAVESHAVVFMYHRFGDARYPSTNITMAQFTRQLDYLAENGYRIWPLERVVAFTQSGRPIPDRTVALTIDDAYRSVYENALPVIRARNLPVTVFVSTDAVDRGADDYMTWDQMRVMRASGVRFANHSASHDHLTLRKSGESEQDWRTRVSADLKRARQRLEEELGNNQTGPTLFAYPYGEYSEALAEVVRDLGFIAFGQHSGAMGPLSDTRALPRYPMAEAFASLESFAVKAASLPLPVSAQHPWDPITVTNPPRLEFSVADAAVRLEQLACYAGGQARMAVKRTGNRVFSVQADRPLEEGRNRYNCTAPHEREDRYYWFSQPWLIGKPDELR